METLSRLPQRRKHSSASNVFSSASSLKSPYDDVLLSKVAASRKIPFKAHEYAEIFSGSSSIPVLDLPGLDKRVRSGHTRQLDYSDIFGGVSDEVAIPYEELLNSSVKKTKQRLPESARPPSQEPDPLHSSEKTKTSSEEGSDQFPDELKEQQFSISFNKTSQPYIDTTSGKTHVAQFHAVPGFTCFVDGTPQSEKTKLHDKPVSLLKREVSRTWSFSAELEALKGKGVQSNWDNGINLKSQSSEIQLPSACATNISFVSKKDASGKIGDHSPPLLDEELDVNSVAGLSAAALKKALDQAEKTIRITKLIMEGKREGFHDVTRSKPKGYSKLKEKKKNKVHHNSSHDVSKEKVVDVANELGGAYVGVHKQFAESSFSKTETVYDSEKVSFEEERVEVHKEVTDISGLMGSAERKAANIVSGLVGNIKNLMLSRNKQPPEEMNTSKKAVEPVDVISHHVEGYEVFTELPKMFPANSNGMQELEKNPTETSERCRAIADRVTEPENFNELVKEVSSPSLIALEQVEIEDEKGHGKGVIETGEYSTHHEEMRETEEMLLRSEFKNILDGLQYQEGEDVQDGEEIKAKSDTVEENGHEQSKSSNENDNLKKQTDDHPLNAGTREIINDSKSKVCLERYELRTKVYVTCDAEIDDEKRNSFAAEVDQVEGTQLDSFPNEAAQTIEVEPKICAAVQESEDIHNAREMDDSSYEKSVDEAIDGRMSDVSKVFSETLEAHDLDLNDIVEGYKRAFESYEETGGGARVSKTFSGLSKDIEMPETDRLRKCFSEELIAGNKSRNAENLSSDGEKAEEVPSDSEKSEVGSFDEEKEKFGVKDANYEENLPKEQDMDEITREIRDDMGGVTRIDWQNVCDFHPSDSEPAECGHTNVEKVVGQTLESDEGCVSTSSTESISHWVENANNNNLNNTGEKDDSEMSFNERSCVEQRRETMQSQLCHDDMEKSMETERNTKTDQTMEKNKENLSETSTTMKERQNVQNFDKDNEQEERIEAIKRGREREKDRKVVERAIREARERAFAEARERAERAAVERAAAEARQRAMAEARDKASLASVEAKIRAERAAVERATAEARGRALEKARSQNTFTESSSSRDIGLKHSFSSPDLEKSDGANTESAQRRKARLERHQRIMERATKALEEKNMRDLVVQKEQAERNRLAESLDGDIKRWAAGKEGNLRALLSTLQYILGADSGWQAISLTEMIATSAVKKAYRKATLYVHPDKLQQRGASIRQKYICEKVFDLLKAAWNRFNSEER